MTFLILQPKYQRYFIIVFFGLTAVIKCKIYVISLLFFPNKTVLKDLRDSLNRTDSA